MTRAHEDGRFLMCRIGSLIGALALEDVRETMRPLPVEPLAGAPSFVLGLSIVRGFPVPVLDAGRLLNSAAPHPPSRFVSLKLGERTASLAVDAVLDIRALNAGILSETPPLLREAGSEIVSTIGALDARLLLVLEAARLVPAAVWNSIQASGATT
jgi:purine-binding chemotaxis protein CheW